jgi:DNA modification methylase
VSDYQLFHGDCLEVMAGMEAQSVDSIVCDPPAGISFMGKKWDGDKGGRNAWIAWMASIAAECLRVLKPGGHAFVWALPRTSHWTATAWEDAGFEVRDRVAHVFGSGFPKSLNVGKAIDKLDAVEARRVRQLRFTRWMRGTGLTQSRIDEITGTNMGGHYMTEASQPAVATREHFEALRPHFTCEVPAWVELMVDERTVESENFKRREIVEERTMADRRGDGTVVGLGHSGSANITAPATPEAQQWDGWGTALKPAMEDWWLFRKPLAERTVAANVLKFGTGAINVDGCRVGTDDSLGRPQGTMPHPMDWGNYSSEKTFVTKGNPQGRWPANLILSYPEDEYDAEGNLLPNPGKDEVLAGFPVTGPGGKPQQRERATNCSIYEWHRPEYTAYQDTDTGSAARFFYVAKSSKRDRNEGCEGLEEKGKVFNGQSAQPAGNAAGSVEDKFSTQPAKNFHPTVKPTALMQYLCRLITPPGGLVLDPFMGSGSTGKGAILEGFRFIGIEQDAEYIEIARRRIEWAFQQAHPTTGEFVTKAGRAEDTDGLPMFGGEQ